MQDLKLQQLFGNSATQNSQQLIISKADLPGLTPSLANNAESLLVALLLHIKQEFEGVLIDELGNQIVDETGEEITYDQRQLYEKLNLWLWKAQYLDNSVLHTLVVDIFLNPPPSYGLAIEPDRLN